MQVASPGCLPPGTTTLHPPCSHQPGRSIRSFRLLLLVVSVHTLDTTLASLASGGMPWGWRQRAGVAGLLAPVIANAAGMLWPFWSLPSFEQHYAAFHKVGRMEARPGRNHQRAATIWVTRARGRLQGPVTHATTPRSSCRVNLSPAYSYAQDMHGCPHSS